MTGAPAALGLDDSAWRAARREVCMDSMVAAIVVFGGALEGKRRGRMGVARGEREEERENRK